MFLHLPHQSPHQLCRLFVEAQLQLYGNVAAYFVICEWAQSKYVTLISNNDGGVRHETLIQCYLLMLVQSH